MRLSMMMIQKKNKKQMAEHIRGTYLLMCGKNANDVHKEIKRVYSGLIFDYDISYSNIRLQKYFGFKRLYDKIKMSDIVRKKIIDPYNIYHPIKENTIEESIDFTDDDFTKK